MERFVLVDGHSLLFKAFFGIPSRITGRGEKPINGVVGFVGILRKVLAELRPLEMLVVFDGEEGSFRSSIDSHYKSNRVHDYSKLSDEENPFSQIVPLKKVLDYLDWKHCETKGVESDDLISSYAKMYQQSREIFIISSDSDLLQLVSETTNVMNPHGKSTVIYTPAKVLEKFGVRPMLIPELKALVGDRSDNIKGIPGVGIKTATRLLNRYGQIASIYEQAETIVPTSLSRTILENRAQVEKNLALIELCRKVDLPFGLSELKVPTESWNKKTMDILSEAGLLK